MGDHEEKKEKEAMTDTEVKKEETKEQETDEAKKSAEADDYAAAKAAAGFQNTEVREMRTETVAVPEVESSENALAVLQETRDLMKRQVKQGRVRTVTGIIAAAFFAVAVVFGIMQISRGMGYVDAGMKLASHVVDQLDVAMGMVGSIEDLIDKIGDELETMDFEALNNTIENMSSITDDISKATRDIAGVTDALTDFTDSLKNFRLFGR